MKSNLHQITVSATRDKPKPDEDDGDYANPPEKIGRDAFLYFDPHANSPKGEFAQCSTCRMFVPAKFLGDGEKTDRCIAHGSRIVVSATMSCGVYLIWPKGKPSEETVRNHAAEIVKGISGSVTAKESGLLDRKVRCENCYFFDEKEIECELYEMLDEKQPELFKLGSKVKAQACCNANTERGEKSK